MKKEYFLIPLYIIGIFTIYGILVFKDSYAIKLDTEIPNQVFTSNLNTSNTVNYISKSLDYDEYSSNFEVPFNYSINNNIIPMYSTMKNLEFPTNNEELGYSTKIYDSGLSYIIKNGYNNNSKDNLFNTTDKSIQQYITQIAIWLYIYEKGLNCIDTNKEYNSCAFINKKTNKIMTSSEIRSIIFRASNNKEYSYLNEIIRLVNEAEEVTDYEEITQYEVTKSYTTTITSKNKQRFSNQILGYVK
ncbi:MAG: hypothetical protein IKH54_07820 [Bacilli bacterium]|nr:hypothetical protein [Bacilli bacterium]